MSRKIGLVCVATCGLWLVCIADIAGGTEVERSWRWIEEGVWQPSAAGLREAGGQLGSEVSEWGTKSVPGTGALRYPKNGWVHMAAAGAKKESQSKEAAVCSVNSNRDGDYSVSKVKALGLMRQLKASLAGLRNERTSSLAYEIDDLSGSALIDTDVRLNLGGTKGAIVAYRPLTGWRKDTEGDSDQEIQAVILEGLGVPATPRTGTQDPTLLTLLVFGGKNEIAYSGLDHVEALMPSRDLGYEMVVEYHRQLADGSLAEPVIYPSLRALVEANPADGALLPFVNLDFRTDSFAHHLKDIGARIEKTAQGMVDHVFIIKGPYLLPDDTPVNFSRFLDAMSEVGPLRTKYGDTGNWLTVISADNPDVSNAYLRQPMLARTGTGQVIEEDSRIRTDDGKRRFISKPEVVARRLTTMAELKGDGLKDRKERSSRDLVLRNGDVFASTGIVLEIGVLGQMVRRSHDVEAALGEDEGQGVLERYFDGRPTRGSDRMGLIDLLVFKQGPLEALQSRYATPYWLLMPVMEQDAKKLVQVRVQFSAFREVLMSSEKAARKSNCRFVYIPLGRSYTKLWKAR